MMSKRRRDEVIICNQRGCKRESCISVNPQADAFLQFCLLHFYGTKFAQDAFANRVFVLNKQVYARQKKPTQQILQRVILEIKDDIEQTQGFLQHNKQIPKTNQTSAPKPGPKPQPQPTSKPKLLADAKPKPKPKPKPGLKRQKSSAEPVKPNRRHLWSIPSGSQPKSSTHAAPELPLPAVTGREFNGLQGLANRVPTDTSRRKVACMLYVALEPAMRAKSASKCADLCLEIEQALWGMHSNEDGVDSDGGGGGGSEQKKKEYMKHARMLLKRLRDPKNDGLRRRVVSRELAPTGLASANLLDLLNPSARKEHDAAQRRIMIQRTKGVNEETAGAKTDDFVCPSCGNTKGNWFVPLQTNSAHVAKTETWGSKDSMDKNAFRVTCSTCKNVFISS